MPATTSTLHSHHTFLFPFKWEIGNPEKENLYDRTRLDQFRELLTGDKASNYTNEDEIQKTLEKTALPFRWFHQPFNLTRPVDYNEYNYFYDHVQEVLYDLDKSLLAPDSGGGNRNLLNHFELRLPDERPLYQIDVKDKEEYKTLSLTIDAIMLKVYNTGVGVLSFHLHNYTHENLTDILLINQYGRRLFPPFLSVPYQEMGQNEAQFDAFANWESALKDAKGIEIPLAIRIVDKDTQSLQLRNFRGEERAFFDENSQTTRLPLHEDFQKYGHAVNYTTDPLYLPYFIQDLFPDKLLAENEQENKDTDYKRIFLRPILDDRMFVVCAVANDSFSQHLKSEPQHYAQNETWYKLVFVDSPNFKTCQDDDMTQALLRKHTYTRWSNYGTFYGMSRYSFVAVMSSLSTLKQFHSAFLFHHVRSMYYKMAELVLVQRATMLRFSDEATNLIAREDAHFQHKQKSTYQHINEEANALNRAYLRFMNKIYFREITAQEQGIELYDKLRQVMRVDEHVHSLHQQIQDLQVYIQQENQKERQELLQKVSFLGAIFFIPSFILSYMGFAVFDFDALKLKITPSWEIVLIISFILVSACSFIYIKIKAGKSKTLRILEWSIGSIIAFLVFGVLLVDACSNHSNPKKSIPTPKDKVITITKDTLASAKAVFQPVKPATTHADSTHRR